MPYIKERDGFGGVRVIMKNTGIKNPGELNYLFTIMLKKYLAIHGESYQTYNDMVGALECAKSELYRRLISEYENKKLAENGEVY